jgi:hypothetical protein
MTTVPFYLPGVTLLVTVAAAATVAGGAVVYLMMRTQVADADRTTRTALDNAISARTDAELYHMCYQSAEHDNAGLRRQLRERGSR